ncbi:PDZ domain-containing protein [bacterium]|nr:PDZ domain-containing protein [bacterium]
MEKVSNLKPIRGVRIVRGFFLLHLFLFSLVAFPQREIPQSVQEKAKLVAEKIKPSIVKIFAVLPYYQQGKEIKMEVSGSGTIIHPDGYVLTNYHVAGNAKYVRCIMWDGEKIDGEYYAGDPLTDLAIIKLKSDRKFPTAKFGDSSKLRVGDWVIAAGSPYALSQSLTLGIVSNTRLVIPEIFRGEEVEIEGENVGSMITWIGHDAPIYPGNSGGPLLNLEGEIVGVNEIAIGLGGAIPGNIAKKIAEELIKKKEITRSWLGIEIQPLLTTSRMKEGVLVSGVIKGSPAEKAGILPGDIILQIGDKNVKVATIEDIPEFNQLTSQLPLDGFTRILLLRKGLKRVVFLKPVKRESTYCKTKEIRRLGITARDISLKEAMELKRDSREGVVVTGVRPGGACGEAKPAIMEKDVIVEIDGKKVKNIEDLEKILSEIKGDADVLVRFERKKEKMLTVLHLKEEKETETPPYAKKGWLPISVQSLTDDLRGKLGIKKRGVIVTEVFTKDKAFPLKVGDIIVEINGEGLPIRSPADKAVFFERLTDYSVGEEIELTLMRDGQETIERVRLIEEPRGRDEVAKYKDSNLGMTVRDLCFEDVKEMEEGKEGVIIEGIEEGGWASIAGLGVSDIILEVNGKKAKNVEEFKNTLEELKKAKQDLVFYIERDTEHKFIEIRKQVWEVKE